METSNAWYKQPETFIAFAALVVSISAVAIGLYEAHLQRRHDAAEVWPHLELATFTKPDGADVYLDNTGIGPGIVKQIVVTVDGKQTTGWDEVLQALTGRDPGHFSRSNVLNHGMRAGDRVTLVDIPDGAMPADFWTNIKRVHVTICYKSVFDGYTVLTAVLGGHLEWKEDAPKCGDQPAGVFF